MGTHFALPKVKNVPGPSPNQAAAVPEPLVIPPYVTVARPASSTNSTAIISNFWSTAPRCREFMKKLDTSSLAAYEKSVEPYREVFANEVIGRFDIPFLPPNVRSRRVYDEPKYAGYEVVMDVFPDVIAYGILLLPKGIKAGEKRPVVVCQHGLEGRPATSPTRR